MPATKTNQYTQNTKSKALIGRAMAHPARVRILELVDKYKKIRNLDLTYELELSKSTIHGHVKKLLDASLIILEYHKKGYYISRNESVDINQF